MIVEKVAVHLHVEVLRLPVSVTLHDIMEIVGILDSLLSSLNCLLLKQVKEAHRAMTRSKLRDSPLQLASLAQIEKMQLA